MVWIVEDQVRGSCVCLTQDHMDGVHKAWQVGKNEDLSIEQMLTFRALCAESSTYFDARLYRFRT
ncbi:hypothetical protein Ljam_0591 [Legionella jamestowniensis]|uniref:Uncharacterized protein n=1 Tax=Legionella jamestowniensis TaxID=455 RepID=A0A0W0UU59_9GAMM|nr:hypothetical protein Ljam_0591 [Legionella jamestowniensis]